MPSAFRLDVTGGHQLGRFSPVMMGVMAMANRGVGVMEGARHIAIGLQANDFTMVVRRFLVMFGGETMMVENSVIGGHSDVSPV